MTSPITSGFSPVKTSFTSLHEFQYDCAESASAENSPHPSQTESTNESQTFVRPSRFRRHSFALSGEPVGGTMDDLVGSAEMQQTQCLAKNESDKLSSLILPSSSDDADDNLQHSSPKTALPPVLQPSCGTENISNTTMKHLPRLESHPPQDLHNPLHSEVVQKYLAALAVQTCCSRESGSPTSCPASTLFVEEIPGMCNWAAQPIASMIMPVHQIRRAHLNTGLPIHVGDPVTDWWNNPDRAQSDVDRSWYQHSLSGFISDTPLLDAAAETAKQLRLAGRRLEATRSRSGDQIHSGFISSGRSRMRGDKSATPKIGILCPSLQRASSCDPIVSKSESFKNLPDAAKISPDPPERSRMHKFLKHLVPRDSTFDTDKYFYMDEKASVRRADALASNLIAPVSF